MKSLILFGLSLALATAVAAQDTGVSPDAVQGAGVQRPATTPGTTLLDGKSSPATTATVGEGALRVCADGHGLPQSNERGEGYENKIAEALAHDLGKKVEYTYFPQRMGFVRNTLTKRDEQTLQYKCDVIIGVPKGYDITATTQPYMHSIYAVVFQPRGALKGLTSPDDLLKLPPAKLHALHFGLFAQTPASDWLLKNGLIGQAVMYAAQSGDPNETPDTIVERDLAAGKIDVAMVWGPVAGFVVSRHTQDGWVALPFKPDPQIKFDYEMSMGLRRGEKDWQKTLDDWIAAHHTEITQILTSYHIPLVEGSAAPQS